MNTFPRITLKTTNFEILPHIEKLLDKRLGTLGKFVPDYEPAQTCEVELEKLTGQQTGNIYRTEINLQVGGTLFRAEATAERMEDAIEQAKNELKSEIIRKMGKRRSLFKRGAQRIKKMIRFGGE
jgi:ribosomal subunit interface protein